MGPWSFSLVAGALAFSTEGGRKALRSALKTTIILGMEARDGLTELADKAVDFKEEIMAEIKDTEADWTEASDKKAKPSAAE